MSNRQWFRVHSFAGVLAGLMLFVICWSGTFAVISQELDLLVTPQMRVDVGETTVSWGAIEAAAREELPAADIRFIKAPPYRWATASVVVILPEFGAANVLVDPYTAEVKGVRSFFNVWKFFYEFHSNLFLSDIGGYLVTASSVLLITSLLSALIFYRRWWTRFFKTPSGRGRALISDLHRISGVWSIWFLIVIGVTGFWYLFEQAFTDMGGPFNYVGTLDDGVVQIAEPEKKRLPQPLSLDEAVNMALTEMPELNVRLVAYGWYSDNESTVYVEGRDSISLVRERANQIHIDTTTGEVLWANRAGDLPAYWLWSNMADPMHFGNFAGVWSKIIYFVFGLILSGLVLTGTWLHVYRLSQSGTYGKHRWGWTNVAIFLSTAIFACSAVFTCRYMQNYGPLEDGVQSSPELGVGVSAVIYGWIAVTLAILVVWSVLLWRPSLMTNRGVTRPAGASG